MSEQYLFPHRQTRRDFLALTAGGLAALACPTVGQSAEAEPTLGDGSARFRADSSWGRLPQGMAYGFGCAVVVDSQDRVIVTSRSTSPAVAIFDKSGKLLETWTKELSANVGYTPEQIKATAHGLYWSQEPNGEFLYWTENVDGGKDGKPRIGARIYKTDLNGKVLHTIGNVATEDSQSQKFDLTNPTDVAVAPNGDIYVVDGYGSQKVHRLDKNFRLIKTIGGRGKEHGQFNTCHGVWVNTLKKEPEVYIADRANGRIEVYSLELQYKRTIPGFRAPCCFYQHDGRIYVPELSARVTILDADDKVVAHLGDGGQAKDKATNPALFATPHALALNSAGDLFTIEWLPNGRPRRFAKSS
jgi:hypothetical protein